MINIVKITPLIATMCISANAFAYIDISVNINEAWNPPLKSAAMTTDNCCNYDSDIYKNNHKVGHTGIDIGMNHVVKGEPVYAIANGEIIGRRLHCNQNNPDGLNVSVILVEHLSSSGEKFISIYGHTMPEEMSCQDISAKYNASKKRIPVVKGQLIGRLAKFGDIHLHFGIAANTSVDTLFAGWGRYTSTSIPEYFRNPESYLNTTTEALPYLSRSNNAPSIDDFDVYGVANNSLYGFLNLTGTFQESSIKANDLFIRSLAKSDGSLNLDEAHRFLDGKHENQFIADGITSPEISYGSGNNLFLAYVKNNDQLKYGYPIKFSFVNQGGIIVDNDQLNADADINNDSGIEPAYNGNVGTKVPGYYLTADLQKGRSNTSAQWKPYKNGDYKIKVHIPEYGATATSVRYVIKPQGNGIGLPTIRTRPVNQSANADKWVKLIAVDGSDTFQFNEKGYIGLSLSSTLDSLNHGIDETQKIAFDAVKFDATWLSRYSTLYGPSDWTPSSESISNGVLKLPAQNSPDSYFWTEHRLNLLKDYSGDNFKLTAKMKNPDEEGGISAYDLCLSIDNSSKGGLGKSVCFMGESWAVGYTGIGGNGNWNTGRNQLVRDLSQWHTIALEGANNTLSVYYDGEKVDEVIYPGLPDKFNTLSITGKGSHSIDWVDLSVNGGTVMSRDF